MFRHAIVLFHLFRRSNVVDILIGLSMQGMYGTFRASLAAQIGISSYNPYRTPAHTQPSSQGTRHTLHPSVARCCYSTGILWTLFTRYHSLGTRSRTPDWLLEPTWVMGMSSSCHKWCLATRAVVQ